MTVRVPTGSATVIGRCMICNGIILRDRRGCVFHQPRPPCNADELEEAEMIVQARDGWYVVGAKGWRAGPYLTYRMAAEAIRNGVAESCSDGGCGDGRTG